MNVFRAKTSRGVVIALSALLLVGFSAGLSLAKDWWPVKVESYYGKYDVTGKEAGKPAKSLTGPKVEDWVPPAKANKSYTIGVSFPHLKDPYWLAVNYGIITEAKRLGVGIKLVAAGGYTELTKQISQVENLANQKVDGIILGSISYTATDPLVAQIAKKNIPVIEVINDIRAPKIAAKALVSFWTMGYKAGEFVVADAKKAGKKEVKVVFLPGPAGSGWAPDTLKGFETATKGLGVKMLAVKWGDTGKGVQLKLIENALQTFPQIDYLVGNAVAADAAVGPVKEMNRKDVKVVSTYIIPPLYDKIAKGSVAAAPSDLTVTQGQMAVNMMVRLLNGEKAGKDFPFRSGPIIPVITKETMAKYPYEMLFGTKSFRPVFKVDPKK